MKMYKQKTAEQIEIDKKCGCECHVGENLTQNRFWCLHCHDKHTKDVRFNNPKQDIYEN